jgi:hypothetical protein
MRISAEIAGLDPAFVDQGLEAVVCLAKTDTRLAGQLAL